MMSEDVLPVYPGSSRFYRLRNGIMPVRALMPLVLTLLFSLMPSSVFAWGKQGHEIVAILAEERLDQDIRSEVKALLDGITFIQASTWADEERTAETKPWHYVDATRCCPEAQCVVGQIERFREVLADRTAERSQRHNALKYLIHFVADLHQPLHAGDKADRGGNDVPVEFLGQTMNAASRTPWNLHMVWDSGILEREVADVHAYAERLNVWLRLQPAGAFQNGSVVDWAMESHGIAKDSAYGFAPSRQLGEDYYRASVPVVNEQLAKAGARLASLLNEALRSS
jgi:nuclease S1